MAAGISVTRQQIDDMAGTTARALKVAFERAEAFKDFLDATPDADLQAAPLGYTAADVANLRSAYADLAQLEDIWRGAATLGVAKDFRTFARRIWGLGVTSTNT